ncbi:MULTISPECIES: helix-turn-helix domain-containing protein [unclassified Arthrobacter]|uniref:helix-turn-helix domain-containing protein n=1 Tax=unclassified Arthrobacter TaxID=235627 RepID=UPI0003119279|nr:MULTISPECIES: helix-turn-helix domain-containing protein [unclassified Arthrobacter]PVE15246.1 DNA-binding protein [Arthrobacter sp. Bz4]
MAALTAIQNVRTIDVTTSQSEEAKEVSRRFDEVDPGDLQIKIESSSGEAIVVPDGLSDLLQTVVRLAAAGQPFGITQFPKALTSVEAAKMLGISRPTLLKLAASGQIASHKVGSHTRFNRSDLRSLAESRLADQRKSFGDLLEFEDSLGFDKD